MLSKNQGNNMFPVCNKKSLVLLTMILFFLPMVAKADCTSFPLNIFWGDGNSQLRSLASSELNFDIASDSKINLCKVTAATMQDVLASLQILHTGRTILSGNSDPDDIFFKQLAADEANPNLPSTLLGIVIDQTGGALGNTGKTMASLSGIPDMLMKGADIVGFFKTMSKLPQKTVVQTYVNYRTQGNNSAEAWTKTYNLFESNYSSLPSNTTAQAYISCGSNLLPAFDQSGNDAKLMAVSCFLDSLNPSTTDAFHKYAENVYQAYVTSINPTAIANLKVKIIAELRQMSDTTSTTPASTSTPTPSALTSNQKIGFWGTITNISQTIKNFGQGVVQTVINAVKKIIPIGGQKSNTTANIIGALQSPQNTQITKGETSTPTTTPTQPSKTIPAGKIITNWKMIAGDPNYGKPYDPNHTTGFIFNGEVQVRGWYEFESGDMGRGWLLRIADEDVKLLPLYDLQKKDGHFFNSLVYLNNASPELIQKLKNASKNNPILIDLKGYKVILETEGQPEVSQEPFTVPQPVQTNTAMPNPAPTANQQPHTCTPNWQCGNWSNCTGNGVGGGQQTRDCSDSNRCGITTDKPITTQSCICTPKWNCTGWGFCSDNCYTPPNSVDNCSHIGKQTRNCSDDNNCGITTDQPSETQSCAD